MIDLTTLSKKELIKEFNVIISEWQKCKQQIDAYEYEKSELETRRKDIHWDIRKSLKFNSRLDKYDRDAEEWRKWDETVSTPIFLIYLLCILGILALTAIKIFNSSREDNFIQLFLFFIIILGVYKGRKLKFIEIPIEMVIQLGRILCVGIFFQKMEKKLIEIGTI